MPGPVDFVRLARLDATLSEDSKYAYTKHQYYGWRKEPLQEFLWRRTFKPIGQGGFGAVYREECIKGSGEGDVRAVKVLQKPAMGDAMSIDYGRELEAIARFSQSQYKQYFVQSSGWYETDDAVYLVMELVQHGSLQLYIGSGLPESDAKAIIGQVLQGLSYMHEAGYTHRDLKPPNLLVVQRGPAWHLKIADFGLSKKVTENLSSLRTNAGTPGYTAPEILGLCRNDGSDESDSAEDECHQSYSNAVDIWAVGAISFLLLTATLPFPPQNRKALRKYAKGRVPFPVEMLQAKNVSDSGCALIESFMAPEPNSRPSADSSLRHSWLSGPRPVSPPDASTQWSGVSQSSEPSFCASASWTTKDDDGGGGEEAIMSPLPQVRAVIDRKPELSTEHRNTIESKKERAHALCRQWQNSEAEKLFREVAHQTEEVLGAEHADTLDCKYFVAMALYRQKKYTEALTLFRESKQQRTEVLGAEHKDTLNSKYWVAQTLSQQRKYKSAERLLRESVQERTKVLGAKHTDTIRSKFWLARALYELDKDSEAESLFRETAQERDKILGAEHKETLTAKFWLARILHKQDKDSEAESLFRESAYEREELLGAEDHQTLDSKFWLAFTCFQRRPKDSAAEKLFRETVPQSEKVLGVEHKDTLYSKFWLARAIFELRPKDKEAEMLFRELTPQHEKVFGADHVDTFDVKFWLARSVLEQRPRDDEAKRLLQDLVSQMEKVLRPKHKDVVRCKSLLAEMLSAQGEPEPL